MRRRDSATSSNIAAMLLQGQIETAWMIVLLHLIVMSTAMQINNNRWCHIGEPSPRAFTWVYMPEAVRRHHRTMTSPAESHESCQETRTGLSTGQGNVVPLQVSVLSEELQRLRPLRIVAGVQLARATAGMIHIQRLRIIGHPGLLVMMEKQNWRATHEAAPVVDMCLN